MATRQQGLLRAVGTSIPGFAVDRGELFFQRAVAHDLEVFDQRPALFWLQCATNDAVLAAAVAELMAAIAVASNAGVEQKAAGEFIADKASVPGVVFEVADPELRVSFDYWRQQLIQVGH